MRTPNVQKLCLNVWEARDTGTLTTDTEMLTQMLYVAVAADLSLHRRYEVECDRRIEWLWQIVSKRREQPKVMPYVFGPLEDTIQFILFEKWPLRKTSAKELAAGNN